MLGLLIRPRVGPEPSVVNLQLHEAAQEIGTSFFCDVRYLYIYPLQYSVW